ncbi:TetR/AcrR family transcriptional regulator [Microbacterium sp. SORGH_AS_0888]|uniref:TetR/AcrR family transcriptional regulator n=1 Tax=Microbacterium sp. SORGH_AS_0888 TaxID=3041791 RepID=UPI002789CEE6|nr:TetR/AcrR family transcriptional regulator [Microbacterium sp. SORGH_AS_0888]MDQ1130694.1 AcrR family transcriptional regulator [Microbacterium sp. SORGH_AS_0888]
MNAANNGQLPLRERNRLRTRNDILDAAAHLLSEKGYAETTLEELSQRAGLSRGTLYAHFPQGRDEIVQEVYLRIADGVYLHGVTLRDDSTNIIDRITALARALVEATSRPDGRFYGIMGADIVPILSRVMGGTSRSFEALMKQDLHEAQDAGLLPPSAPVDAVATALTGAIRASGAAAALDPATAENHIEAVRYIARGLLAAAPV